MKIFYRLILVLFFIQLHVFTQQDPIKIICNAPYVQDECDVDGDYVVWVDGRDLQTHIYLYRISDSTTTKITTINSQKNNPKISGNQVVWQDNRNGNWDIYQYRIDLPHLNDYALINYSGDQYAPDLNGTEMVYIDSRSEGSANLFYYDIVGAELPLQITTDQMGTANNPSIDGNIIAFQLSSDIYMYHIFNQEFIKVCDYPSTHGNPAVSGRRIIWQDDRNGNWDLYMFVYNYFVSTPDPEHLYDWPLSYLWERNLPEESNQTYPHLYQNKLVFSDDKNGNNDIYLCNFGSATRLRGTIVKISESTYDELDPAIEGDKIVWWDDKNPNPYVIENSDIYLWQRPQGADLSVDVSTSQNEVQAGDYVTYTILVTNLGPMAATGAVAVDTVSTKLQILNAFSDGGVTSFNGQVVTCTIGDLPADSTVTIQVIAMAIIEGLADNRATVSGTEIDYLLSNNSDNQKIRIKLIISYVIGKGNHPRIEIDPFGYVHIVYAYTYYETNLFYATNRNGMWETVELDDSTNLFLHDLDIDQYGNVHVCYAKGDDYMNYSLYYINNIGGSWNSPQIIESNAYYCSSPNIQIDKDNYVHFCYLRGRMTVDSLIYVTNKTGAWVSEILGGGYISVSMDLDTDGYVHIVTYNFSAERGPSYITNAPGGTWQPRESVESGWLGGQMETLSLDIDVDNTNNPHVSYVGRYGGDAEENYKYATRTGGVWQNEYVDEGNFQGGYNAIVVDKNNVPTIMYVQPEKNEMLFSKKSSGVFESHFVDQKCYTYFNQDQDITTDANNFLHLVYSNNGVIRYGTNAEFTTHYGGGDDEGGGYFFANSTSGGAGAASQPSYEWIDPVLAGHTEVTSWSAGDGDNGYYGPVNINFTFPFFTRFHNEIYIGTNGYISFEVGYDTTAEFATIPYPDVPNNIAAACAMDLNVDNAVHSDAHVYFGGNSSRFVVTYVHAYDNGSAADYITFQIILYPDGNIKYQYNSLETTDPLPVSISEDALIGIENFYGTRGISYRNNGVGGPMFGSPMALMFGQNNQLLPVEQYDNETVNEYYLRQNYPNPFNPTTKVSFVISHSSFVTLKVYDILGREVATLVNEKRNPGQYEVIFDGSKLTSGVYFYRLQADHYTSTKKLILLK